MVASDVDESPSLPIPPLASSNNLPLHPARATKQEVAEDQSRHRCRGFGDGDAAQTDSGKSLFKAGSTQRRAGDAQLPVGRELAQIRHVDEAVVVEVAASPEGAGLPVGGEGSQVGDIHLVVEVGVAEEGVADEDAAG